MIEIKLSSCHLSWENVSGLFCYTEGRKLSPLCPPSADFEDLTSEASARETIFTDLQSQLMTRRLPMKHQWMGVMCPWFVLKPMLMRSENQPTNYTLKDYWSTEFKFLLFVVPIRTELRAPNIANGRRISDRFFSKLLC